MKRMTAKERVLAEPYPEDVQVEVTIIRRGYWPITDQVLGTGSTESKAWAAAARRLTRAR